METLKELITKIKPCVIYCNPTQQLKIPKTLLCTDVKLKTFELINKDIVYIIPIIGNEKPLKVCLLKGE